MTIRWSSNLECAHQSCSRIAGTDSSFLRTLNWIRGRKQVDGNRLTITVFALLFFLFLFYPVSSKSMIKDIICKKKKRKIREQRMNATETHQKLFTLFSLKKTVLLLGFGSSLMTLILEDQTKLQRCLFPHINLWNFNKGIYGDWLAFWVSHKWPFQEPKVLALTYCHFSNQEVSVLSGKNHLL